MDVSVSIAVAGEPQFLSIFAVLYGAWVTHQLAIAAIDELAPLVQRHKPDILLLQGDLSLADRFQDELGPQPPYCIAIFPILANEGLEIAAERLLQAADALKHVDAYLSLYLETPPELVQQAQERLLVAQMRAGLRQLQRYRDVLQTNDFLSAIALADSLTELSNRRALEWELPRQVQAARARGTPLSLLMLDVDYFKQVNDTHGHLVGDRVLQLLAARLRDRLRVQDTAFRYGSEEFVVLLRQTKAQQALAIAERLRRLIGEQPFCINRSLTLNITISLGVACLRAEDDNKGLSFLDRADQNLLHAKASGRNRVSSSFTGGESS